jgi:carbon-monoxide dehydrogenase small subunit
MSDVSIELNVNGRQYRVTVAPRMTLVDCLRDVIGLTGSHIGCEHGICGACSILLNGEAVRGCLMFAVQAEGAEITTVEGLSQDDGALSPLQQAFWDCHGLQCGYCTPGMLIAAQDLLNHNPHPNEAEIRDAISGNICRCTGYQQIVEAIQQAVGQQAAPDEAEA